MTLREARKLYYSENYLWISAHRDDPIMINLDYMIFLDSLVKSGDLSARAYDQASNYCKR